MFLRRLPILLLAGAAPALAQRTTNNAVTASDDAFGRAVGNEKIGIYTTEDVRGFNPIEAGNVRIEGLYFDQQSTPSSRLVDSSAVRVGYAAHGYPFPAPTGIADLAIEKFEGRRVLSVDVEAESHRNVSGSIQAKVPLLGDKLGISAGIGARSAVVPQGRNGHYLSAAVDLAWRPYQGAEVVAFISRFHVGRMRASPIIFPAGSFVPPHVDRRTYLGQPWAHGVSIGKTNGALLKLPFEGFRLEAGVFRNVKDDPRSFADLELGTGRDGTVANRVIIADEDSLVTSNSGEIRLTRDWETGDVRQSLVAAVRGRMQNRIFGGQQRISLGRSIAGLRDARVEPAFAFGPDDHSRVRQATYGLGYDVRWKRHGSIELAIQKSNYRKETRFADPLVPQIVSKDHPILLSANATMEISADLTAYGGYVSGLEESAVAPDIASNRSEAPPAIRTSQVDAGLRYAITPKLSVVAGLFRVRKPYFNIDATSRFRQLGTVTNSGIEMSLAGTLAPGLTVVAGTLLLDPKVNGEAVAGGIIGPRPIGSVKRHSIANFDWKPPGQDAWSFDLAFESFSCAAGNRLNSFVAPARETLGIGARYRFQFGSTRLLLRAQITNLFNDYGWKVSSSGGFTFTLPRTGLINLAADF